MRLFIVSPTLALLFVSTLLAPTRADADYSLTTGTNPSGTGTVRRSPNQATYPAGSEVTLTATPASGFSFLDWSGDASGSTNPLTITMDGAKVIYANFDGYSLTLNVSPPGSGTVTSSPNRPVYPPGAQVTLTAGGGFPLVGWTGDTLAIANPLTITMDGPKDITANFQAFHLTTTMIPASWGSITRNPNASLYPPGPVMLTAVGTNGYAFSSWSGDASGSTNPITLYMDSDKSVTASLLFAQPGCGNWTLASGSALLRAGPGAAWDPVNSRVLRFGGYGGVSGSPFAFLNDLWSFTPAQDWVEQSPSGTLPSQRDAPGFLYDPVRSRMLLIYGNNTLLPKDVWQLSLSGLPAWTKLTTAGTPPTGRFAFSTIYDPVRDRVLMFGGSPNNNEVWQLSLAGTPTWSILTTTGTPPAGRYGHGAIYDPVRDRMLVHGGSDGSSIFSDTWALPLSGTSTWTQLSPIGVAPQVYLTSAIYDPIRDRMLLVSGHGPPGVDTEAIWSLSLKNQPAWSRIPTGGTTLGARYFHASVYEPDLDLVLAFNGISTPDNGPYLADAKRLDCAGGFWLQTAGDHGTVSESPTKACYGNGETVSLQAVGDAGYAFQQWTGDLSGNQSVMDVTMDADKAILAQFFTGPVGVENPAPIEFALEEIRPNPTPGPVAITYSLPSAAHVKLAVYDIAGRQLGGLVNGVVAAGRRVARWDELSEGQAAKSGVYFVRYETPAGASTMRFVLLR